MTDPQQLHVNPCPQAADHDKPPLDPSSFTAHRLHHAAPLHLHLTSRRIFVGPIPIDWLRSHRSEWYKEHLHLYYSKRKDSFRAGDNVCRKRSLSGLDRVDEEDEDWWTYGGTTDDAVEEEEDGETGDSDSRPVPPALQSISYGSTRTDPGLRRKDKGKGKGRVEELTDEGDQAASRPWSSPVTLLGRRNPPRMQSDLPRTRPPLSAGGSSRRIMSSQGRRPSWLTSRRESFATAQESWETPDEFRPQSRPKSGWGLGDDRVRMDEPLDELSETAGPTDPDNRPVSPRSSEAGESSYSQSPSLEAATSLASLLKKDSKAQMQGRKRSGLSTPGRNDDVGEPSTTKTPTSELGASRTSTRPSDSLAVPAERVSTSKDRVTSGFVRFNTNADTQDRDRLMQQKLAEASRKRSVRYGRHRHHAFRKQEGEIVRMENMLVRIEIAPKRHQLPDEYDENGSMKVPTRIMEKWREYVVVCRESVDDDTPMCLQLYKSRNIPAVDRPHVSSHSTKVVPLAPKSTQVNLFSSLDKTLVIWLPHKHGTIIYIMRPRCASVAVEWYSFLRNCLRMPDPTSLQIFVPDLSLYLRIEDPFCMEEQHDSQAKGRQSATVSLLAKSMGMLEGVQEWSDLLEFWKNHERMGLAWRRYDRLEWIHGANKQKMYGTIAMQKTHELELRPMTHYPTETTLKSGEKMTEPPPVEGFLIRLTSNKGRQERLGKMFSKRLYFTTHDNFFCFCRPGRALPPAPPTLERHGTNIPAASEVANEIPIVYAVAPYSVNDKGDIEWLATGTPDQIEQRDHEAYTEAERKVNTLLRAEGFVDLCEVKEVRPVKRQRPADDQRPVSSRTQRTRELETQSDRCFEMELNNGLILRLQSFDEETRDEWVTRLSDLVKYWKCRDLEDLALFRRTRAANLSELHVDEEMESLLGQYARKWEVSRSIASTELYNVCGLSSCRTITLSGVLYRKPRIHSTFRRYNVILCHGELLVFQNSYRNSAGVQIPAVHHERHISISLRDCYIYSGLITEADLLYQNQTFDPNSPGHHALPRVYPDGYTSHDEDTMTCFVLWYGHRRTLFKSRDDDGRTKTTRVAALGSPGKAIVFKARSRVERDTWVISIANEIERLNTGVTGEIRVTTSQKGGGLGLFGGGETA